MARYTINGIEEVKRISWYENFETLRGKDMKLINADCMEVMKEYPDKYFDLAIVDPPYGIGASKDNSVYGKSGKSNTFKSKLKKHKSKSWDESIPCEDYFLQLQRISKNQIIWGGNYFTDFLYPVKSWIFWYKKITNPNNKNFSDGELAWCSNMGITRYFAVDWIGFGYINSCEKKIHPTQKPVKLYSMVYEKYSKPEYKILDTHLGSGSNAIAWHYYSMGKGEFVGIEIDKDYFQAAQERIKNQTQQLTMF